MGDLTSFPWSDLTPPVLLGLAVLLLLLGRLVPRRTYNDMRDDRDHWRAAHEESEAMRHALVGHLDLLLENSKTTETLLRSIASPNGHYIAMPVPPPEEEGD